MLGLTFCSKLDWESYIISIAKTASQIIGALIRSMKFPLRLLCISINLPYDHPWNTVVMSGLMPLVVTWNFSISYKSGYVGLSVFHLLHLLKLLAYRRNVASLSLFCRYYFRRCSSEHAQLVPRPFSRGRYTRCSDRLHDFFVTIPRCCKDVNVNSFFPRIARPWNYLLIECFPLTYDLSGFKCRINRYLLIVYLF